MKYEIKELDPLETRVLSHSYHMIDNSDTEGTSSLVKCDKNTFLLRKDNGHGYLSPPFEETLEDPLDELIHSLRKDECGMVHLMRFPRDMLRPFFFTIAPGESRTNWKLYQKPRDQETYQRKLKRFRNSGYSYRELTSKDIPKVVELTENWAKEKRKIALENLPSEELTDSASVEDQITALGTVREELSWLDHLVKPVSEYERLFSQPLTRFYGVFQDEEMLGYMHTEGNNSFQVFHSRAAVRKNSHSPQEFLDYAVAKEFVSRGVKLFDRGWLQIRTGMIGLVEYKRKFGEIDPVIELNYDNVRPFLTRENRYLGKLFEETSN